MIRICKYPVIQPMAAMVFITKYLSIYLSIYLSKVSIYLSIYQFSWRMKRSYFTKSNQVRVLPRDAVMEKRIFTAEIMSIDNSTGTAKFKVMFSISAGVTFAISRPTVQIHWEVL